ncbi:MAG: ATP-binding protein [Phycisphaerales bacterium]|nr:ATP-binding protein [Phycisphaerales bacterium]
MQELLRDTALPRDSLPYTATFDELKAAYESKQRQKITDHDFWLLLDKIGKFGGLASPGKKKKGTKAPSLSSNEQLEILRQLQDWIGNRDHLPYTTKFDDMHRQFGKLTGRKLSKHEFWRALSNEAKKARKPKPVHAAAPIGSLTPELVAFLEDRNPWWRAMPAREPQRFRRWAFAEMVRRLDKKLAAMVVIRGSRRVGKSVLQSQLIEDLLLIGKSDPTGKPVDPARILSVQFDDAPALGGISMPVQAIVRWFEQNVLKKTLNQAAKDDQPAYLLFDEVQNIHDWSVQLKILADNADARIIVTGSSALRIAKGKDNLAGRMDDIVLGPLRLWEVAGIRGIRGLEPYAADVPLEDWKKRDFWLELIAHGNKHAKVRDEAFRQFSRLGGYPLCHNTSETDEDRVRQQVIAGVINKTIESDPEHRRRAAPLDPVLVREVFRMVCRYAGQAVTPKRFSDELHQLLQTPINNAKVTEAIEFLTDSLLVHQVPPLELLAKKQGSPSKLCVCDHFVRNGVLQETLSLDPEALKNCDEAVATQVGHLIESVLGYFLKGIPGVEVSWFPERAKEPEVDLVLTIGTGRIPVEVKYRRSKPDKAALAGIESFCGKSAYAAPFGIIVTQATEGPIGDKAIAVPASTFLLLR